MAVYAISWVKSAHPSSGPQVIHYPEAASQSFKKGDPVKLDTAGRVLLAVDTESGPFGVANGDASGTTDALVPIIVINGGDVFSASGSAAGATRTVARADVGLKCSWIKSTVTGETAKSVIDVSDTTGDAGTDGPVVEILDNKDAVGTVDGRYYFRFAGGVRVARGA